MSAAFSTCETNALERKVEIENVSVELEKIWNKRNQTDCINWLRKNGYKRICLQFPDDYLPYSNELSCYIKHSLSERLASDYKVFILADTSYGSCCVDEIAAAHVQADCMIHFGDACRSKTTRLPVLYIFPHFACDLNSFFLHLQKLENISSDDNISVILDIGYHHLLQGDFESCNFNLKKKIMDLLCCKHIDIDIYPKTEMETTTKADTKKKVCIFIGEDNNRFFNVSLTTKADKWFMYSPTNDIFTEKNPLTANYIRRRYYYIEKCKDAKTLGLIIATLTADGYLEIVQRLQDMAKCHGIKTQIISVGRINPAKLANFLEIDCFVLVGCPFNNVYNMREFYKPIVSVFEAEIALNPAWYMKYPEDYVTDFKQFLPNGRNFTTFDPKDIPEQDVSLITGCLRSDSNNGSNLSQSNEEKLKMAHVKLEMASKTAGKTFEDRTWKGLDPALGLNEPAILERGLSGIPIKYTHK